MSSGLLNAGRLERKFLYESSGDPNEQKLRYNDPTFVSFRILFDFEPIISNDEVVQGLLLPEERDESAISYLRRMGEKERGEALKEFVWLLDRISNDFPWFFKSVSNLDSLWKWGHPKADGTVETTPASISVSCYETVDLRITALADLYRKSTWDRRYFRNMLTVDKRRFNMTVIFGEARKLRTFVDPSNTEWLDHVSAVAFRCLDCEFDFSGIIPSTLDGSDAPAQMTPSFSIKINRVQETNSYRLLNYMLGEMTRDLVIAQGGSGAEVNTRRDMIDYRSLLSPLVRTYEGNYDQLLLDSLSLKQQLFMPRINFVRGDRTFSLPREERNRINAGVLNSSSKELEQQQTSDSILGSIDASTNIRGNPSFINFGRPDVNEDIQPSVQFTTPRVSDEITDLVDLSEEKTPDTVPNQINFVAPVVQTELSDFSFNGPKIDEEIDQNVNLERPQVDSDISSNVSLNPPTVDEDIPDNIGLLSPTVDTVIIDEINLIRPTVDDSPSNGVDLLTPSVDEFLDTNAISFGRPTVEQGLDESVTLVAPTVLDDLPQDIEFRRPTVEDDFES